MSCQEGSNHTLSISIPGAESSQGDLLDVSAFSAEKTIEVCGKYEGSYCILGSHDGSSFAPVLMFKSDGSRPSRQACRFFARYLMVRRQAMNLTTVTATMTARESINCDATGTVGANQFIALGQISAGAGVGPGTTIDLWSLVAPTGFDSFDVVCSGDFEGTIAIEGSQDAKNFSPIGEDSAGELTGGFTLGPPGNPRRAPAETSPIFVRSPVRYLRTNLKPGTIVRGPVNITIGGSQNCAGTTPPIAGWSLDSMRLYAIDQENGDDSRLGYVDLKSKTIEGYKAACKSAKSLARRTVAGLGAVFPRVGAGRLVEVLVSRGSYDDPLEKLLGGAGGYAQGSGLRGTGTNPTAGCEAFDGSLNDCVYAGGQTPSGLNEAGYSPDVGSNNVLALTPVGGGVASFPAEPAKPLGLCLRFGNDVPTAALRNACYTIVAVNGGNVTTNGDIVRTALDICFIEDGGVVLPSSNFGENSMLPDATNNLPGWSLNGVRFTGTSRFFGGRWQAVKSSTTGLGAMKEGCLTIGGIGSCNYVHPIYGSIVVGGGLHNTGNCTVGKRASIQGDFGLVNEGILSLSSPESFSLGGFGVIGGGLQMNGGCVADANAPIGAPHPSVTNPAPRIIGPVPTRGVVDMEIGYLMLSGIDLTNSGSLPAIVVLGSGLILSIGGDKHGIVTGVLGNNDVGLDLVRAYGCTIAWSIRPTVTGALGDVRLGTGIIISWSDLAAAGTTVDGHGNHLSGP